MISVKSKNQKMCVFVIFMLLWMLLLLLSTATCEALTDKDRFERSKAGSYANSELKASSRFHLVNNANKNRDQVFGDDKRKVFTGPNPLHNR
jgi:hypothetical protein